jgi:hypothetical protein
VELGIGPATLGGLDVIGRSIEAKCEILGDAPPKTEDLSHAVIIEAHSIAVQIANIAYT